MRTTSALIVGCCCLLVVASGALAESTWPARVPNGGVFTCSACHTPTFEVNPFGVDFLATNPSDPLWTPALAAMDSDGDGFTNGTELLDPTGAWVIGNPDPGDPGLTSNPGDENSVAVEASTWGQIKDLFVE